MWWFGIRVRDFDGVNTNHNFPYVRNDAETVDNATSDLTAKQNATTEPRDKILYAPTDTFSVSKGHL